MKTVEEEWERYRDTLYPDGTSAAQAKECRQAFIGGMMAASLRIQSVACLPDGPAEQALELFINDVKEECRKIADGN